MRVLVAPSWWCVLTSLVVGTGCRVDAPGAADVQSAEVIATHETAQEPDADVPDAAVPDADTAAPDADTSDIGVEVGDDVTACLADAPDTCCQPTSCEPSCDGDGVVRCEHWVDDEGCPVVAASGHSCGAMTCKMDPTLGVPLCANICAAMDAASGPTACATPIGYAWDGSACRAIACSCVGSDCDRLAATEQDCINRHQICVADWTVEKRCQVSGGWWWEDTQRCNCGDGAVFVPDLGCWPVNINLCDATGGWWYGNWGGKFFGFCGCGPGTGWRDGLGCAPADYTAVIDWSLGGTLSGGNATLTIPPRALQSNALEGTNITFSFTLVEPDLRQTGADHLVGQVYELGPFVDAAFSPKASLALPLPAGIDANATVSLAYFDLGTTSWKPIESDVVNGHVVGAVSVLLHFAVYVEPAPTIPPR